MKADLVKLLQRYLDNHCQNADIEGMGVLCECQLCLDTRAALAAEKTFPANRTLAQGELPKR